MSNKQTSTTNQEQTKEQELDFTEFVDVPI
jgi:hypothetical protein